MNHGSMLHLTQEVQERLLGRPVGSLLTADDRQALSGQRVLVTGAGGSVGGEIARQLATCGPERLTLLDHSEYLLFQIEQELRYQFPQLEIDAVVGDVSRGVDIRGACREAMPHAVYHAAAYKHVPIAERSILPAARTNVLGTAETLRAARDVGARFVLISSDKAAEPRSVMGATKRLAELLTLGAQTPSFQPVVVRFGNILGSSGSVLEVMSRSVQLGCNVPVTDPDATRFFMTGAEAASLVLKADLLAQPSAIFWLEMGEPLRIGTLVERFIEWATPSGSVPVGVDIVGLRPGEKVHEELTTHGLDMKPTGHPRILRGRHLETPRAVIATAIRALQRACADGDCGRVLGVLVETVTDFVPSEAAIEAAGRKDQARWAEHERLFAVAAAS